MYGSAAPDFHADPNAATTFSIEDYHRRLDAVRALVLELETQLMLTGRYEGSKVALMRRYDVKLSVLAVDPIYVELPTVQHVLPVQRVRKNQRKTAGAKPRSKASVARVPPSGDGARELSPRPTRAARATRKPARYADEGYE